MTSGIFLFSRFRRWKERRKIIKSVRFSKKSQKGEWVRSIGKFTEKILTWIYFSCNTILCDNCSIVYFSRDVSRFMSWVPQRLAMYWKEKKYSSLILAHDEPGFYNILLKRADAIRDWVEDEKSNRKEFFVRVCRAESEEKNYFSNAHRATVYVWRWRWKEARWQKINFFSRDIHFVGGF